MAKKPFIPQLLGFSFQKILIPKKGYLYQNFIEIGQVSNFNFKPEFERFAPLPTFFVKII